MPYDFQEWKKLPFHERVKKVCQVWGLQGYGTPTGVILYYFFKIAVYIFGWIFFCSFSTDLGLLSEIHLWVFNIEALGKAIIWTMLFEVLGFGGASGPLGGRYLPPIGACTYYLRPGTIKSPLFPKMPLLGNDKRNILDVLLYIALVLFAIIALCSTSLIPSQILPLVIILPVLGIFDKQIFLAARGDVWYPAIFVLLFPLQSAAALKMLWFGVWFWAAFSKLTPSFTSVVGAMVCNSPIFKMKGLRKMLFKDYPEDLRMSDASKYIAHFGTLVEFSLPILLMAGTIFQWPFSVMCILLVGMTAFHAFIFFNIPMGVPMEWNVIMVYGGWLLFAYSPSTPIDIQHSLLWLIIITSVFILPIIGNFFPKYVSFLLSMRYYAGTWPYSIWLFKGNAKQEKLKPNLVCSSKDVREQLIKFIDEEEVDKMLSRVIAFRFMHLPSRALHEVIPKAVQNIEDYQWYDGELIGGEVLGWNFGDGHLHSETLLASVQKRANFDPGELRVIMVESPQMHNGRIHWRIHDAKDGLLNEGYSFINDLKNKMPWPTEIDFKKNKNTYSK